MKILSSALALLLATLAAEAFTVQQPRTTKGLSRDTGMCRGTPERIPRRGVFLWQSANDDTSGDEVSNVANDGSTEAADVSMHTGERELEADAANQAEDEVRELTVDDAAAVNEQQEDIEEDPPQEDPELVALKEEIAILEQKLKEKRRQSAAMGDSADEMSKAGYARKVAEMENMRRKRTMMQSSNKSTATASILADFLPVLDKLIELREAYGEDEFGRQYNALPGAMKTALVGLGVKEYAVSVGDKVDASRIIVVEAEHSDEYPVDTVIRPVADGLELEGNPIRMASCVASLGPVPADLPPEEAPVQDDMVPNDNASPEDEQKQ